MVSFHPEGNYVASAGFDNTVKLWDVDSKRYLNTLVGHASLVKDISFSKDGRLMASVDEDGVLFMWETTSWKTLWQKKIIGLNDLKNISTRSVYSNEEEAKLLSFSANGKYVWSIGEKGKLLKWEVSSGELTNELKVDYQQIISFVVDPLERFIAVSSESFLKLLDYNSGNLLTQLKIDNTTLKQFEISTNGEKLAIQSASHQDIFIYTISDNRPYVSEDIAPYRVKGYNRFAINSTGDQIASVGLYEGIIISDLNGNSQTYLALGYLNDCFDFKYHPRTGKIAFAVNNIGNFGFVWFLESTEVLDASPAYTVKVAYDDYDISPIQTFSVNEERLFIAVGSQKRLGFWDIQQSTFKKLANGLFLDEEIGFDGYTMTAFHPNENVLYSGRADNLINAWDMNKLEITQTLNIEHFANYYSINNLSLSEDGNLLSFADQENTIRLLDAHTLDVLDTLEVGANYSSANGKEVRYGKDNRILALYDRSGNIKIFDVFTGKLITKKKASKLDVNQFNTLSFTNDSKLIYSLEKDTESSNSTSCTIKLWDVATKEVLQTYSYAHAIDGFVIDSKQQLLATSYDGKIDIRDKRSGSLKTTIEAHKGKISNLEFTTNFLLSTASDGVLKIWDKENFTLLATLYDFGIEEYVVVSPTGLFDASPKAMEKLYFVKDLKVLAVEQFTDVYLEQGLLNKIWNRQVLKKVPLWKDFTFSLKPEK